MLGLHQCSPKMDRREAWCFRFPRGPLWWRVDTFIYWGRLVFNFIFNEWMSKAWAIRLKFQKHTVCPIVTSYNLHINPKKSKKLVVGGFLSLVLKEKSLGDSLFFSWVLLTATYVVVVHWFSHRFGTKVIRSIYVLPRNLTGGVTLFIVLELEVPRNELSARSRVSISA